MKCHLDEDDDDDDGGGGDDDDDDDEKEDWKYFSRRQDQARALGSVI